MYCNNFYNFNVKSPIKEENRCNKIFRPWDSNRCNEDAQDSTISTTTDENDDSSFDSNDKKKTGDELQTCVEDKTKSMFGYCNKTAFKTPKIDKSNKETHLTDVFEANASILPAEFATPLESYPPYPEMLHANLAHSLGLTPTDPLFLESLSQGYAIEEYARVLSQEHQTKILNGRKQRPKKYKCPHCDVGFSNNGQLKGHVRIHTGERPFKCDEKNCGKTFTRNEELTRHKRIHSGLRPFPCTQCGKRFGRKDHLKKHSRTHMQPRGLYAVPVMLPFETWSAASAVYPYVPMFGY